MPVLVPSSCPRAVPCSPDGSGLTLIGDTNGISTATETSGVLDISVLVGYQPGSVLLTSNQESIGSLSVLINSEATLLVPERASHVGPGRLMSVRLVSAETQIIHPDNLNSHRPVRTSGLAGLYCSRDPGLPTGCFINSYVCQDSAINDW